MGFYAWKNQTNGKNICEMWFIHVKGFVLRLQTQDDRHALTLTNEHVNRK